jgi:hypothetical protein
MNKKRHQREINRLVREANKSIEKDDLWYGRFCIKQVESPQWHVYEDKSGAEYFVHLKFIDKCTGRYWIQAETVNHWRGNFGNGWRIWDKMNWFIVEHCNVWDESLAKARNYDAWREYNRTVRKV